MAKDTEAKLNSAVVIKLYSITYTTLYTSLASSSRNHHARKPGD